MRFLKMKLLTVIQDDMESEEIHLRKIVEALTVGGLAVALADVEESSAEEHMELLPELREMFGKMGN